MAERALELVLGPRRRRRAQRALAAQLPDVARSLARGVAAGLPFDETCSRASAALEEPAAALLAAIAGELRAGVPATTALAPLGAASGGALVAGAVVLHEELGGDLARGLHALADGLADRARLEGELRAVTAQARLAARLVPLVPVAAAGMLAVASPASVEPLLGTAAGMAVLAASGSLTGLGLVLVRRIMAGAGA